MTQVTQAMLNGILAAIRSRRGTSSTPQTEATDRAAIPPAPAKLRQAEFSDYAAVIELKRRWGLIPESYENWERFWRFNPSLKDCPVDRPMGWVLEAEGRVVGYQGSISSTYFYGDRKLTAVSSTSLVVEPSYRSTSLSLTAAYYRQKADLYLVTTAIPSVGRIAKAFKSDPLPQSDYDTVLFWVLEPYPFVQAVAKRLNLQPSLARIACFPGSLFLRLEGLLRRRWPAKTSASFEITQIRVDEIGDQFQSLWLHKLNEKPQLLADRSPEALRWHFTIPGDTGTTRVLCCHKNGELVGYVVYRSGPNRLSGLHRTLIADMLVKNDDPEAIRALLSAAYKQAKKLGSCMLEVLGLPDSIRRVCHKGNPYMRKYPAIPFYYKAAEPELHNAISQASVWYATPFDGDTTLMP